MFTLIAITYIILHYVPMLDWHCSSGVPAFSCRFLRITQQISRLTIGETQRSAVSNHAFRRTSVPMFLGDSYGYPEISCLIIFIKLTKIAIMGHSRSKLFGETMLVWLVVSKILKNMKVSWDDYSQLNGKNKKKFQTTNQLYIEICLN